MMIIRAALAGVLAVALLASPLAAEAQQAGKVYRVGYPSAGSRDLTAKTLGLTIPPSLLARADQVIE